MRARLGPKGARFPWRSWGFGLVGCFVLGWVGCLGFVLCWLAKKMEVIFMSRRVDFGLIWLEDGAISERDFGPSRIVGPLGESSVRLGFSGGPRLGVGHPWAHS
jgi:hypothetical protein